MGCGCLILLVSAVSPRIGLFGVWLLTNWLDRAFSGFLLPVLGFFLAPWTTLLYTMGYIVSGDAFSPWGVVGLAIGITADVLSHAGSVKSGRDAWIDRQVA